jgi:hypothetical protein
LVPEAACDCLRCVEAREIIETTSRRIESTTVALTTMVFSGELEEIFSEASDQDLWTTYLLLDATAANTTLTDTITQLVGHEVTRRFGKDALENAAELFTNGRFTHREMMAYVRDYWASFLATIKPEPPAYIAGLMEATDQELAMAVTMLHPVQRERLKQFLGMTS